MHVKVLEENIDYKSILKEVENILSKLEMKWDNVDQIGLQGHKPDLNPVEEYKNSVSFSHKMKYPETYFKYNLWDTPLLNKYIDKYGLVRSRIMKSKSKSCLSMHRDLTKRVHIPLFTNENCFMVIDDNVYRMEVGKIYLADTTLPHTAINASWEPRAHIVGCLY